MLYIVNVSGGLTSHEALRRTVAKHGAASTRAVFADTTIEDPDLYRFLDDIERVIGISITRLADGRTPFDVWHDERMIKLKLANGVEVVSCSKVLKRQLIDKWITNIQEPYTRVFGMNWDEAHRMDRLAKDLAPIPVWFPLAEKPYLDKCHIQSQLESVGVKTPALYLEGFDHNNCGGGCVKAGQAAWALLWCNHPDRYAVWEEREDRFLREVNHNAQILRDRRGGESKPMSLKQFRQRIERGETYDTTEWGGCGCFASTHNMRFDDLLAETVPNKVLQRMRQAAKIERNF